MGDAKKVVSTVGKVLGTTVVGGIGVVAAMMSAGSTQVPEVSEVFGGIKDGCFGVVKKMWDENSSSEDMNEDFSKIYESVQNAPSAEEAAKEYYSNKRK